MSMYISTNEGSSVSCLNHSFKSITFDLVSSNFVIFKERKSSYDTFSKLLLQKDKKFVLK